MSKDNNNSSFEIEINIKSEISGPEVTELQQDIAKKLIEAIPDDTKISDGLTAGCLYIASLLDQCLPERKLVREAFYAISILVAGFVKGQYKDGEGDEDDL